jgi:hypothetical protein
VHSWVKCETCRGYVDIVDLLFVILELGIWYFVYLLHLIFKKGVVNSVVDKTRFVYVSNCCLIILLVEMCHLTLALFDACT